MGYTTRDIIAYVGIGVLILVLWIAFRRMFIEEDAKDAASKLPTDKK